MNEYLKRILALTPEKKRILAENNPLSFAQQRLWFIDQLSPGGACYNIPGSLRLLGILDRAALKSAINEIVQRHATLRTCFPAFGGRPLQVVLPALQIGMAEIDLAHLPDAEREAELCKRASEEAREPFDLANGPLIRATLFSVSPEDHLLLVVIHHIVSDGWSQGVLTRELSFLYNANVRGEKSSLDELPIQYVDFAIWQRQHLQNSVLEKQLSYWRKRLDTNLAALELPLDHPRPATQSFRGGKARYEINTQLAVGLENLAKREGATLFMVMLAAFKTLLHRYTGQEDIVVGSPIANRNRKELEGLIGFFVNSLVLRDTLKSDMTFRELLRQVKETALGAYDHQDLPFEKLVEELNPERDMSRNPLFQVIFAVQNAPMKPMELDGLTFASQEYEVSTTRLDLELHVWQVKDVLRCIVYYSTDIFENQTIERLLRHYETLLEEVVKNSERRLADYPLVSERERDRLLVEFNQMDALYERDTTVHACFEAQVRANPNAFAISDNGKEYTYKELDYWANGIAQWLTQRGLGNEARVGILAARSAGMIAAVLGILKAGAAYLPLDPTFPQRRLLELLDDGEAASVISDSESIAMLGADSRPRLLLDRESASLRADVSPQSAAMANSLAYVMYTSGSTGTPKGVCVEHRNIVRLVKKANYATLDAHTIGLVYAPLAFDASTFELFGPLLNGGRVVLQAPGAASIEELATTVEDNSVNTLWLTAGLFHQMAERGPLEKLGGLRQWIAGGDVLHPGALRRVLDSLPHCRLINGYGPTECTTFATTHAMQSAIEVNDPVPIGRPLQNTRAYVLDESMQPAPIGVPGELYIAGDGVARGYLNRPDLTAERFVHDPFSAEENARMYRTGDRARWTENGVLHFLGRNDGQVKMRGYRIELGEIESVLREHPAVAQVAVALKKTANDDKKLVGYIVQNDSHDALEKEIATESIAQVERWRSLYDETYSNEADSKTIEHNFHGWNSSYTGQPIPVEEMREWQAATVANIRAHNPRRVWEIGCGTGLLLGQLAPSCEEYCGTDFSASVLTQTRQLIASRPGLERVHLQQRVADDFSGVSQGAYDTVILNSVVQYFPTLSYLEKVLSGAVDVVAEGGSIYIGDVRSLPLHRAYAASVMAYQAGDFTTRDTLASQVRFREQQEEELVISPDFFHAFAARNARIASVEIAPKRGSFQNELTRFRYEVVLRIAPITQATYPSKTFDWQRDELTIEGLAESLASAAPGDVIAIARIPNARVAAEIGLLRWLNDSGDTRHLAELRAKGVTCESDPEKIAQLAERMGWRVQLSWSESGTDGSFSALFAGPDVQGDVALPPLNIASQRVSRVYSTNPLQSVFMRKLAPHLQAYLGERLPQYMVPGAYLLLEELPLNANGKVDRNALPMPEMDRSDSEGAFVAPRTEQERRIAELFSEVLGTSRVGVNDSFFNLGGHSLLATQLISRIRESCGVDCPLRVFFENPTVGGLAEAVQKLREDTESGNNTAVITKRMSMSLEDQLAMLEESA